MKWAIYFTLMIWFVANTRPAIAQTGSVATGIRISEQSQVQTICDDIPVKRFGFCWVLSEAPTLLDDAPLQEGNNAPRVKVHPKDSREIKRNYLSITTTRMPRSTENDYLPVEAVHLIDGNIQTCWLSHGQARPTVQPIWIRLAGLMGGVSTRH